MSVVIGVDVGGTKVTAGPVDEQGRLLAEPLYEPTVATDLEAFVAALTATLRRALDRFASFQASAIGLACAGTVDGARATVVSSPNLPLVRTPLAAMLAESLGLPVILENDVNAALLAEARVGAAVGMGQVAMIALGTGVGGAFLLDGRIYRGVGGGAGEFGHMIVCGGGEQCRCGARGCLEMYVSGRALARFAAARAGDPAEDPRGVLAGMVAGGGLEGQAIGHLAGRDYPGAVSAVAELAHWLGRGLLSIVNIFNPEMVVVGGGVSALGEAILEPARAYVCAKAMRPANEQVQVVQAALGNRAGLVGAALGVGVS